jgi:uncharacterized lipoprotein YmbA
MKKQCISAFFMVVILLGCSNTPQSTQYYLLINQPSINTSLAVETSKKSTYQVSINMPEYLSKPYLVMQTDDHQIHYSLFHLWAEPLSTGINASLLFDLNTSANNKFIAKNTNSLLPILTINIDYFHVKFNSTVVFSGHYWTGKGEKINFVLEKPLESDGYQHSVKKMRFLINDLAANILSDIGGTR